MHSGKEKTGNIMGVTLTKDLPVFQTETKKENKAIAWHTRAQARQGSESAS